MMGALGVNPNRQLVLISATLSILLTFMHHSIEQQAHHDDKLLEQIFTKTKIYLEH
jgi:hypothetical protein